MMKTISVFIAAVVGVVDAMVGELKTYKYETSGTVYIKNDKELFLEDFNYNGRHNTIVFNRKFAKLIF